MIYGLLLHGIIQDRAVVARRYTVVVTLVYSVYVSIATIVRPQCITKTQIELRTIHVISLYSNYKYALLCIEMSNKPITPSALKLHSYNAAICFPEADKKKTGQHQ